MDKFINSEVAKVFRSYPDPMRQKLLYLRQLILDTVSEMEGAVQLEETLKWGEPSYLTKNGSTVRLGWKKSKPNHYAMYFHCTTRLVETFKELYRDCLTFEGNRAIVFHENSKIPEDELKHCIKLSLTYHDRKHLQLLGA